MLLVEGWGGGGSGFINYVLLGAGCRLLCDVLLGSGGWGGRRLYDVCYWGGGRGLGGICELFVVEGGGGLCELCVLFGGGGDVSKGDGVGEWGAVFGKRRYSGGRKKKKKSKKSEKPVRPFDYMPRKTFLTAELRNSMLNEPGSFP